MGDTNAVAECMEWSVVHLTVVEVQDSTLGVEVRGPLGSARVTMDFSRCDRVGLRVVLPSGGEYVSTIDSWTSDEVDLETEEGRRSIIRLAAQAAMQCLYRERLAAA